MGFITYENIARRWQQVNNPCVLSVLHACHDVSGCTGFSSSFGNLHTYLCRKKLSIRRFDRVGCEAGCREPGPVFRLARGEFLADFLAIGLPGGPAHIPGCRSQVLRERSQTSLKNQILCFSTVHSCQIDLELDICDLKQQLLDVDVPALTFTLTYFCKLVLLNLQFLRQGCR